MERLFCYKDNDLYNCLSFLVSNITNKKYIWKRIEFNLMDKFCNLVYLTDNNDYSLYEIDKKKILLEWKFAYIDKVNNGLKEFFLTKSENYIQLNYLYDIFSGEYLKYINLNDLQIVDEDYSYIKEFLLAVKDKSLELNRNLSLEELYLLSNLFINNYKNRIKLERR